MGLDAVVFRSGLYYRWADPDSTAGTCVAAIEVARTLYSTGARNVLVVGDSRIGNGFSGSIADAAVEGSNLHFLPVGIPGTTPRVWPHVTEAFDMEAHPLAAAVFIVLDLDDTHEAEDLATRALDLAYLAPLLGITDLLHLPPTFDEPVSKQRAVRQILLPGTAMHSDAMGFIGAPINRIERVLLYRREHLTSFLAYPGHSERIDADIERQPAAMRIDPSWAGYVAQLNGSMPMQPPTVTGAYRTRWFGAIAERCRKAGVPMLLLPIPRGPYHRAFGKASTLSGSLALLQEQGALRVLDPTPFRQLEEPQYFFDILHLNADGRRACSTELARAVKSVLEGR